METLKLYVRVALKHILSEPDPVSSDDSDESESSEDEAGKLKVSKKARKRNERRLGAYGVELLDFNGPKLMVGLENWLLFYKIIGQINWVGKPLYLSVLYKLVVVGAMMYALEKRILMFYKLDVIGDTFRNPIFMFIQTLALVTIIIQMFTVLRANLFDLCPMYKILSAPKLCFLKEDVLHTIGTKSLRFYLLMSIWQSLVICLLTSKNLSHFIGTFHLPSFVLDVYANTVFMGFMMSASQIDFYIRSAFGHWLLALQCYLEQRFTHLHRHQRLRRRTKRALRAAETDSISPAGARLGSPKQPVITFDEIQSSLNHMDDHLELLRSVQITSLLNVALLAFLAHGATFLISYHLLANQKDLYHGFLFLMEAINFTIFTFFSYFGDSWIHYALTSFAQTVEDEYFTQNEMEIMKAPNADHPSTATNVSRCLSDPLENCNMSIARTSSAGSELYPAQHQLLLIRKKDVLFCREFLHQFENHLATPWSKLDLITQIHLLRTFVTLIAAQIIFDHEH